MQLTSPAFADGGDIPRRYGCEGDDRPPPLQWEGVPEGTVELALLLEDPDAPGGTFEHWVVWGIDPVAAGVGAEGDRSGLPAGAQEGVNDFGGVGYRGPCPPRGRGAHRYHFSLLALSAPTRLTTGRATAADVRRVAVGSVLAEAFLTGRFERR